MSVVSVHSHLDMFAVILFSRVKIFIEYLTNVAPKLKFQLLFPQFQANYSKYILSFFAHRLLSVISFKNDFYFLKLL